MQLRFPWEESDLKDEIPQMAEMEQEEREQCLKTFQGRLAFLESLLLTDYMLFSGLNIIKRGVQYWLSNGVIDKDELEERLKQMPWFK
ncbi:unnamed protein product, partial [Pocillopora meandrina]